MHTCGPMGTEAFFMSLFPLFQHLLASLRSFSLQQLLAGNRGCMHVCMCCPIGREAFLMSLSLLFWHASVSWRLSGSPDTPFTFTILPFLPLLPSICLPIFPY